ncbi:MAG TPA: aldehyde dehydrogenase family protein [Candidatus Elarobacter sp.]|nr:aldehyde dehydrogenase family protein [Candidatus Elarobacter sp.]
MTDRIPVIKTPKVYVGGAFIRSESGRTFPVKDHEGNFVANVPQCTRKDLRNAVEAAAKAGPGWAARTPYNRGQIVYRLAEMLESRVDEMAGVLRQFATGDSADPVSEIYDSIDRLVHFAGWADKYEQVLGSANPVAAPYFNFTLTEPMGVIGLIASDRYPLLGLVSQAAAAIVSGNTVVALASETTPYPAITLGEMLATSDLPGGVVNILTGFRRELVPTFATHTHIRALDAVAEGEDATALRRGAADSVKRVKVRKPSVDWTAPSAEGAYEIRDFIEFKTVWHPVGA